MEFKRAVVLAGNAREKEFLLRGAAVDYIFEIFSQRYVDLAVFRSLIK
ncbi:hypothetical protein ACFQ0C_09735 [Paenibacillus sp. GCM10027630]